MFELLLFRASPPFEVKSAHPILATTLTAPRVGVRTGAQPKCMCSLSVIASLTLFPQSGLVTFASIKFQMSELTPRTGRYLPEGEKIE